jgi:hypothetical protein
MRSNKQSRDGLKYTEGCAKIVCKYYVILYKGLECSHTLVSEGVPGTNRPQILTTVLLRSFLPISYTMVQLIIQKSPSCIFQQKSSEIIAYHLLTHLKFWNYSMSVTRYIAHFIWVMQKQDWRISNISLLSASVPVMDPLGLFVMLEVKPMALHMLGKHSTTPPRSRSTNT